MNCQCGGPMTPAGTGWVCVHCDRPPHVDRLRCWQCAALKKSKGLGPRTTGQEQT